MADIELNEPEHDHLLDSDADDLEEDDIDVEEEGPDEFDEDDDYDQAVMEGWEDNIERANDL